MKKPKIDAIIPHTDTTCVSKILQNTLICALVVLTLINLGCSKEIPADPMCRTNALYPETAPSAAACLIKSNGKLLVVKSQDNDGWNLPNHKQLNAISAQCTAHLAVWKSTGLNVEVGQLLFTSQKQTQYYACALTDDFSSQLTTFPVPSWANRKISRISLIDPFKTQQDQWISDIDLITVREAYTQSTSKY